MDIAVTERFVQVVRGPQADLRLDQAALLIAAHVRDDLDVAAEQARLDHLAAGCRGPGAAAVVRYLFGAGGPGGFTGDRATYYDPRNSFLDQVLDRRRGIPITLSVLAMEVARRMGVELEGVSLPGHFLVLDSTTGCFYDVFDEGRELDRDGCTRLFAAVNGPGVELDPAWLEPVGARAIVARMLANLSRIYAARAELEGVAWVSRLRIALPGSSVQLAVELARAEEGLGRWEEAATTWAQIADRATGEGAMRARARSRRLRARMN